MFVSIVIIALSMLLFLYWFRYTCLLILSTKTAKDYTTKVASANQLEFPGIVSRLKTVAEGDAVADMGALQQSLERDYRLLTGLLQHAAQFQMGGLTLEQRMLMIDYQVMKLVFGASHRMVQPEHARKALAEMADIVAHFANAMGERSAVAAKA
ncbi:MAG: hypothetical protein JNK48_27735 [Bryobacterales bacterium]|nr:hypothetical protein [Bryobacterales bacterium]